MVMALTLLGLLAFEPAFAEEPASVPAALSIPEVPATAAPATKDPKWYDLIRLRGYTQLRYNNLPSFDINEDYENPQGDRYIGGGQGLGIRRARLVVMGDVHPRVSVYMQTDFASVVSDNYHVPTMRDWYADLYLAGDKALRLRAGQSKVPFGFENLQSSQNRLPFDRNDALNSALKDERDLGVFAYWSPEPFRARFKSLVADNLKGSGDYGVLALGFFNGQTANKADVNGNFHVVGRVSVPVEVGSQAFEVGAAAYTGKFRVSTEAADDGTEFATATPDGDIIDRRAQAAFVWYPKPIGLQAEFNFGEGPELRDDDTIGAEPLFGGYAQVMVKVDEPFGTVSIIPYVRGQMYDGGKKFEKNAPSYHIREVEGGIEWQVVKAAEVTLAYAFSDRTGPEYPYEQEQAQLLRAQLQFNY
jgi:hypothetical protein